MDSMNMDSFAVIRGFADFTNDQAAANPFPEFQMQQQHPQQPQPLLQSIRGSRRKNNNFRKRPRTDIPFITINDSTEHKDLLISTNLHCFHGYKSVFSLQHKSNFLVDGVLYKSVDQYYQMHKVKDLMGVESEKFKDGSTVDFSSLAKELLKSAQVSRSTVDQWRTTRGVELIQKALLEKLRCCDEYRNGLQKTDDKIIVQSYAGDDFFGAGVPFKYVKDWCQSMAEKKVTIKLPMAFPLTAETVKNIPVIAKGRNVLGTIHMILREKLNNGQLDSLFVTLSKESIKPQNNNNDVPVTLAQGAPLKSAVASEKMESQSQVGGNTASEASVTAEEPMSIDFTSDVDAQVVSAVQPQSTPISNVVATSAVATTSSVANGGPAKVKIPVRRGMPRGGRGRGGRKP